MNGRPFNKKPLCEKGGVTLVEVTVVMAIITVLFAAAAKGLIGYYQYGEWKRQNQYAKIIYLAAQSELTQLSQSGWPLGEESLFTEENRLDEEYGSGIYFLEARGASASSHGFEGDYKRYQTGELDQRKIEDRRIQALYQLLDPYILDKSVFLEGTIRIELQPWEGLVSRCFYSSQGELPDWSLEGKDNGSKWKGPGCYGVDTLLDPVRRTASQPQIQELKLYQQPVLGESERKDLYISWELLGEALNGWKQLSYDIGIYGGNHHICTILINAEDDFEDSFLGGYVGVPKKLSSLDYGQEPQMLQAKVCRDGQMEWYCFEVSLDEREYQITLKLDSMEETSGWREEIPMIGSDSDAREEEACFFLRRFLLAEEDIPDFEELSCRVIGYQTEGPAASMKESNPVRYNFWEEEEGNDLEEKEKEEMAEEEKADERDKP